MLPEPAKRVPKPRTLRRCDGPRRPKQEYLTGAHLGDLDLDPELDLRQHAVEARIARPVLEAGGGVFQPAERRGIERARQQADLELVERVERGAAARQRAAAALGRVLDSLQRDQRVDAADRAQARCGG